MRKKATKKQKALASRKVSRPTNQPAIVAREVKSTAERVRDTGAKYNRVTRRKCADPDLRAELEADPPRWLKHFFPRRFNLPWAPYHLDIIADSLYAIAHGTNQLIIAPRGGGKSRPMMGVVLFSLLTGRSAFPVYAPWKAEAVAAAFRFWLAALGNNKALADLYPEFCDPFRHAKGNPHKTLALSWEDTGENTGAQQSISSGLIIMPDSLGIIGSTSINGNPLGMAYDAPDGSTTRPTILFFDDPQDYETAHSPIIVEKTVRKIDADFGGMGGPDSTLAMIMAATVKDNADVTTHYRRDPEWHVKSTARVTSWPKGFDPTDKKTFGKWAEWNGIRVEGGNEKDGSKADRAFYEAHKRELTQGMTVSWPDRYDAKKGQPDAFYSAMLDFFRMGPVAFASEQQGEPLEEGAGDSPYNLDVVAVATHTADRPAFAVPPWCAVKIASTDLNPSYALTSVVVGFGRDQTAAVVWYGLYEAAPLPILEDLPAGERQRRVFDALTIHGKQLAAMPCKPDVWHIDASGEYFPAVLRFCEQSQSLIGIMAIGSTGVGAKNYRPFGKNVLGQPREYCHMRSDVADGRRRKWFAWQADYWREIAQRAWLGAVGAPGSVALFEGRHKTFAEQVTRERLRGKGLVGGQMFWNWQLTPGGPHDYGDCMAQAFAGAAGQGIGTGRVLANVSGSRRPTPERKCRVAMEENPA